MDRAVHEGQGLPLRAIPDQGRWPAAIQLWMLPLRLDQPPPEQDWTVLAPAEAARARRFRQPADVVRSACTRAALRRLLGARIGVAAQDVALTTGPWGRPGLVGAPGLDFNVSHAGACALIALANQGIAVGVDIERHAGAGDGAAAPHAEDMAAMEALVLSPDERATPPQERLDFMARWTAKEAVLKCLGLGVAQHLQAVSVRRSALGRMAAAGPVPLDVRLASPLPSGPMQVCSVSAAPGYAAAIAWSCASSRALRIDGAWTVLA